MIAAPFPVRTTQILGRGSSTSAGEQPNSLGLSSKASPKSGWKRYSWNQDNGSWRTAHQDYDMRDESSRGIFAFVDGSYNRTQLHQRFDREQVTASRK